MELFNTSLDHKLMCITSSGCPLTPPVVNYEVRTITFIKQAKQIKPVICKFPWSITLYLLSSEASKCPSLSQRTVGGAVSPLLLLLPLATAAAVGAAPVTTTTTHRSMAVLPTGNVWFCGPCCITGGGLGSASTILKFTTIAWANTFIVLLMAVYGEINSAV